ncbi:MAG: hypothetical protein JNK34_07030 [Tabrizicola sp.]|nr:hypothetical protein [Tabrizicola sp.]
MKEILESFVAAVMDDLQTLRMDGKPWPEAVHVPRSVEDAIRFERSKNSSTAHPVDDGRFTVSDGFPAPYRVCGIPLVGIDWPVGDHRMYSLTGAPAESGRAG